MAGIIHGCQYPFMLCGPYYKTFDGFDLILKGVQIHIHDLFRVLLTLRRGRRTGQITDKNVYNQNWDENKEQYPGVFLNGMHKVLT